MSDGFSQANIGAPYQSYKSSSRYVWKQGTVQLPIASPSGFNGNPVAILQIHAPNGARIFSWTVSRRGQAPVLPDRNVSDPNQVFTAFDVVLENPDRMADATNRIYTASGVYVYLFKKPIDLNSGLMFYEAAPYDFSQAEPVSPGEISSQLNV